MENCLIKKLDMPPDFTQPRDMNCYDLHFALGILKNRKFEIVSILTSTDPEEFLFFAHIESTGPADMFSVDKKSHDFIKKKFTKNKTKNFLLVKKKGEEKYEFVEVD